MRHPQDAEERVIWCQILLLSRSTIVSLYFNTMLFNFLFRVLLILYADRGLVCDGKPNLLLFRRLYWRELEKKPSDFDNIYVAACV